MKIAYFGLPLGALLLLADGHDIALCVLSPIAAPGRRRLLNKLGSERVVEAPAAFAKSDAAITSALVGLELDLLVSWFWTRKVLPGWLTCARLGGIGVHPSLLPRHRGPNPYFWTIDAGDPVTGVSVHELDESYDTGAVIEQRTFEVGDRDAWQLARALDRPALGALRDVIGKLARGDRLPRMPQDESTATWAPEPEGANLCVDWRWPTERVLRRIRALAPVPGLAIELAGQPLFVIRARQARRFVAALEPGEAFADDDVATIRTGDGAIEIVRAVSGEGGPLPEGESLAALDLAFIVRRGRSV